MEGDWDYFGEQLWAAERTLLYYHQFPMWDPYRCGGTPLFASPFLALLSPFGLLRVILPPMMGLHLQVPIYLALGWAGGYILGRVIGLRPMGSIACATVYPASSWFFLHLAIGHFNFMPFMYLPWLLSVIWMARPGHVRRLSVVGGVLGGLIFFESGPTVAVFSAPLIAIVVIWLCIERNENSAGFVTLGIAAFAIGLSAIKLLPTLALVSSRPVGVPEADSVAVLIHALLSRNQNSHILVPGSAWGYYEYGAYVGAWFGALALVGLITRPRKALPWLLCAIVLFAMSAGHFAWWAPWPLLHHLPPFSSEHVQPRFLIFVTLAVGVLAGIGADSLSKWFRPWGAMAALAIIVLGLADAWKVSVPILRFDTRNLPDAIPDSAPFRQFWNESDHGMLTTALSNLGAVNCMSPIDERRRPIGYNQYDYRGEQYLTGQGEVTLTMWTPNRLEYEVNAVGPTRLVINENFDPGWRLSQGLGEVRSSRGLLSVSLGPGRQHLVVTYRAPWIILGSIISVATIVIASLMYRGESKHNWFRIDSRSYPGQFS